MITESSIELYINSTKIWVVLFMEYPEIAIHYNSISRHTCQRYSFNNICRYVKFGPEVGYSGPNLSDQFLVKSKCTNIISGEIAGLYYLGPTQGW